jgi:hypothetical protein
VALGQEHEKKIKAKDLIKSSTFMRSSRHDITKILLKVALNTITLNPFIDNYGSVFVPKINNYG